MIQSKRIDTIHLSLNIILYIKNNSNKKVKYSYIMYLVKVHNIRILFNRVNSCLYFLIHSQYNKKNKDF